VVVDDGEVLGGRRKRQYFDPANPPPVPIPSRRVDTDRIIEYNDRDLFPRGGRDRKFAFQRG
jgi:hypothetical protein